MKTHEELSVRLAAALLMRRGEVSMTEIQALPFVEDEHMAFAIAAILRKKFDVETYQRRNGQASTDWEDVICFRERMEDSAA